jgi:hypothetical protein
LAPKCVSRSIELEAAATKPPKSEPFDIVNDEKQKEKQVADQFFRSLLNNHQIPRTEVVVMLDRMTSWLWPTSTMLMANENSGWLVSSAILVMSSLANGSFTQSWLSGFCSEEIR